MKIIRITVLSIALVVMASCSSETPPAENVTIINEAPEEKPEVEVEIEESGSSITIEKDENGKVSGKVDIELK